MRRANAVPGGGKWPDFKIGADGKFARKDLHAKAECDTGGG